MKSIAVILLGTLMLCSLQFYGQPCFVPNNNNLIVNGGFESGNSGFTTSLTYDPGPWPNIMSYTYHYYDINTNSINCQPAWDATGPCSGQYFMCIDGWSTNPSAPNPELLWSQNVSVTMGTVYTFSFCLNTMESTIGRTGLSVTVKYSSTTVALNPSIIYQTNGAWITVTLPSWTAIGTGTATFSINQIEFGTGGCDFGLDNIRLSEGGTTYNLNIGIEVPNAVCDGACDGTATVVAFGGTAPYSYSWSNGQTTATAINLCAGTYTVTVTDANGCTGTASATVIQSPALNAFITGTPEGCHGLCDGIASVMGLYGLASGYSFSWSPPVGSTQTVNNLCSGVYSVVVTDANGCTVSLSISLINEEDCGVCKIVNNPDPQTHPIPDQDCWWSTGGNSNQSVSSKNQLGTTDKIPLRVVTNNTERMRVEKDGRVGINTLLPQQQLHVNGSQLIDGPFASLYFGGDVSGNLPNGEYGIEYLDLGGCYQGLNFWKPWLSHNLSGNGGMANFILFLNDDGNVGIGVDPCKIDPNYKLSVCGNVLAHSYTAQVGWCDFVFDKEYKLMSLIELENYINQNKHLPEIPPATEIETKGADLGDLLSKQMQKIEELTLYLIQQNKEIENLKMKLDSFQK